MKALITRKLGMTSAIAEDGTVSPITLLIAESNVVTQVKTKETDGYLAVQVGTGENKKLSKAQAGHFKKAKVMPKVVKEFIIEEADLEELTIGKEFTADSFSLGDKVKVTSVSKGKGFAGTIKRHNFHRGRKTHGGRSYRRPGSIGSMYPQKIFKGKKMAGRMGHDQVTIRNLTVGYIDTAKGIIGVVGSVPGPKKSVVIVKGEA